MAAGAAVGTGVGAGVAAAAMVIVAPEQPPVSLVPNPSFFKTEQPESDMVAFPAAWAVKTIVATNTSPLKPAGFPPLILADPPEGSGWVIGRVITDPE